MVSLGMFATGGISVPLFIGFIWLIFEWQSLSLAFDIAFEDCQTILARGYEGINTIEDCNIAKGASANIVFFFYLSTAIPMIDVASFFIFINKFHTPFITRKPTHLVALISNGKVEFIPIKEWKPFFIHKGKMYYLSNGVLGSYGNIYHIFMVDNNQELTSQERTPEKVKFLLQAFLSEKTMINRFTKFSTMRWWVPIRREQFIRFWDMTIYKDFVEITPKLEKKRGMYSISMLKSIDISLALYRKWKIGGAGVGGEKRIEGGIEGIIERGGGGGGGGEEEMNEVEGIGIEAGGMEGGLDGEGNVWERGTLHSRQLSELLVMQKQEEEEGFQISESIPLHLLKIEVENNMSSIAMHNLYKQIKETVKTVQSALGSPFPVKWIIIGGIIMVVLYMVYTLMNKGG